MSSEDEEDSVTPRYSPLLVPCDGEPNNNIESICHKSLEPCVECNLSSRRYPITCENDLYRTIVSCTHEKQQMIRSSSALTFLEHKRRDLHDSNQQPPPPKLTTNFNSNGKEVVRPIAYKPIVSGSGSRFYEGPTNHSLERHGSETTLGSSNGSIDTQRFGGSLCNVLASSELHLRREVSESVPYISNPAPVTRTEGPKKFFSNRLWYGSKKMDSEKRLSKASDLKTGQSLNLLQNQLQQNKGKLKLPFNKGSQTIYSETLKTHLFQDGTRNEAETFIVLRREIDDVRSQLDEAKWALCHRTGEMALLKARLKDSQGDQVTRCNELVQLRTLVKDLNLEISTLRAQLSQAVLSFRSKERENVILKQKLDQEEIGQKDKCEENVFLRKKLNEMELRYSSEYTKWDREKKKWIEEQKRVLRYQKALQHNYLLTCQKAQILAAQVESFSSSVSV